MSDCPDCDGSGFKHVVHDGFTSCERCHGTGIQSLRDAIQSNSLNVPTKFTIDLGDAEKPKHKPRKKRRLLDLPDLVKSEEKKRTDKDKLAACNQCGRITLQELREPCPYEPWKSCDCCPRCRAACQDEEENSPF